MARNRKVAPSAKEVDGDSGKGKRQARGAYALTCANCRTRKIKCDGGQPECRICLAYGERCHYDKPPPMSQVLAMASRIKDLERRLEIQQRRMKGDRTAFTETDNLKPSLIAPRGSSPGRSSADPSLCAVAFKTDSEDDQPNQDAPYYRTTSAVEEPTLSREGALMHGDGEYMAQDSPDSPDPFSGLDMQQLGFWEQAAIQNCSSYLQLAPAKVAHLLKTHWTWVHPQFMFVSRPAFLRDAAAGGRFFSQQLLCALCLHSTRFTSHWLSEDLLSRARLLLSQSLHKDPSIPTVQALLQLSAREIGQGGLSSAWLYSGMAFRMALDLGIFSKGRTAAIGMTDSIVSRQLAWSCYLWDKAMSLYLGRTPMLSETPAFDPPVLDPIAEQAPWVPYYGEDTEESGLLEPMQSHTITCFANFCRLSPIINDILVTVYAKRMPSDIHSFIQQTGQRLDHWQTSLPQHLIIDPNVEQQCPPPHILGLNLLFYTARILLHRPFRQHAPCHQVCHSAADAVERLLLMLEKTYGLSRVTYMMAYCAYTAATVAVLDMHCGTAGAQERVNTYLRALYGARGSCPSIQRSIDIVIRSFETSPVPGPGLSPSAELRPLQNCQGDFETLPAFMFDQNSEFMGSNVPNMDPLPFGELDPFAYGAFDLSGNPFCQM